MVKRPERRYSYETNGSAISKESFRIVREGADLTAFTPDEAQVAVRMIHTAGDLDLPRHIVFHPGLVSAARGALRGGAPIFVDANMVKSGITRRRLPADNEVHCFLRDQRAAVLAAEWGTVPRQPCRCGATTSRARWSPSGTPRRRCSTSWK